MRISQILLENRNVLNVKTADHGVSIQEIISDLADFPDPAVVRWTQTVLRNYLIRDYTGGTTRDVTDDLLADPDRVQQAEPWVAQALARGERLFVVEPDRTFTGQIREVQDYLRDLVARQPGTNLSRISVPDALQQSRQWHRDVAKQAAGRGDDAEGVKPVMNFHDGYQWIELQSAEALKFEGGQMQHCVGGFSYSQAVASGETRIFSLRDPQGKPHVTVEADSHIRQVKGKQNAVPVAKYVPYAVALLNALKLPPAGQDIDRLHLVFNRGRYGQIHEVASVHETVPGGNWYYWVSVEPATEDEPAVTRQFYALLDGQQVSRMIIQTWGRGSSVSLDSGFDFRPFTESVCRYLTNQRATPDRIRAIDRDDTGRQDGISQRVMDAVKALRAADIVFIGKTVDPYGDAISGRWADVSDRYGEPQPTGTAGYSVAYYPSYHADAPQGSRRIYDPEGQPLLTLELRLNYIQDFIAHPAVRTFGDVEPLVEVMNQLGLESEYGRANEETGLDLWFDEKNERFGTFASLSKASIKFTNGYHIRFVADTEGYSRLYRLIDPDGQAVAEIIYTDQQVDAIWPLAGGRRAGDDALPDAEHCSLIAAWMSKKNFRYDTAEVWMVVNNRTCRRPVRVTSAANPEEVATNTRTLEDFLRSRSVHHLDAGFCRHLAGMLKRQGHAYVDGDDQVHDDDPEVTHFMPTVRIETVPE